MALSVGLVSSALGLGPMNFTVEIRPHIDKCFEPSIINNMLLSLGMDIAASIIAVEMSIP
jgi:hypothetical protein